MWDRKELKYKGKAAYRANRLMCIVAALLLTIASGAAFSGAGAGSGFNALDNASEQAIEDYNEMYFLLKYECPQKGLDNNILDS